ncbi:MAG: hypothetical protein GWP59_04970 [Chlamydiales bacterium]|nr:hypothetical protein [Chlamydiales bacterium]NCF71036.1 hypothetical protein [Chlamydiales bacterium]
MDKKKSSLELDHFEQLLYKIANERILMYPFPHFFLKNVFSSLFYQEILDHIPQKESYISLAKSGKVAGGQYPERFIIDLNQLQNFPLETVHMEFWKKISAFFNSTLFKSLLIQVNRPFLQVRFQNQGIQDWQSAPPEDYYCELQLVKDTRNYSIAPHTDNPRRLLNLLFYLPKDNQHQHLGTSLYKPKDPHFSCEGQRHHNFEDFKKIHSVPFEANSLLYFFKTTNSFHGVERIEDEKVERDLLLLYLGHPFKNR